MTEAELVALVTRILIRRWPVSRIAHEARSHGRCRTDVCLLLRRYPRDGGGVLVGVEAKLTNWARAIAQAALNRFAVDLSYVAMPSAQVSEAALTEAGRYGVGVLAVENREARVALAARAGSPDLALRNKVIEQMRLVRSRAKMDLGVLTSQAQLESVGAT